MKFSQGSTMGFCNKCCAEKIVLTVLVTGANGFVGSHIVETLLEEKHRVLCVIRKTSNLKWIKNLPLDYICGDLNNKSFLETNIKNVDVVVHCAGIVRAMDREKYFETNVGHTKTLCEVILKNNCNLKKFIFISSQAAMGPSKSDCARRITDRENPVSDYGLSKLAAELEIRKILQGKVPYTILRPACVYGPRDKDIFIFFNLVHKHIRPVTIRERLLQLVYVKDVAKAVVACLENEKSNNNIYYLADSIAYTWADIGKTISSSVGVNTIQLPVPDFVFRLAATVSEIFSYVKKKPVVLNKQKVAEMLQKYWIADTQPAEIDLNIKFTCLEVASKITYNWYLENGFF
ncbi:MAG: NAD-dependent epimerase/dehydratase family protein [Endomicrobium sp.]|jgi:nucleoside-diphosphate-sugar epimerase|nr:NAD-dependent epimerase/dehydratase family protein [Endomicrobium sp.]